MCPFLKVVKMDTSSLNNRKATIATINISLNQKNKQPYIQGLVLKLIPCFMLTIFMTLLVRMLIKAHERRTRLRRGPTGGISQAERTTIMLTAIVAVFLITELPQGILVFAIGKLFK